MNKILIITVLLFCMFTGIAFGQAIVLNSNQPAPLLANAGEDVAIEAGKSVIIGENPSASYGYGGYVFLWSPIVGLDDPAKANPLASPTVTTTYLLTVTDFRNCSTQDEVTLTVKASGIDLTAEMIDFKAYPNPTDGRLRLDVSGFSGHLVLKVINSTGMIVHQAYRDADLFFSEELDTRFYAKGNYFVLVILNDKVLTRSIIIN